MRLGGVTENADVSKVNLAYILSDGEKIKIPNILDESLQDENNLDDLTSNNSIININTADKETLEKLPRSRSFNCSSHNRL